MLGMMALFTGCRRGELLALRWEDIDRKTGTITINKKINYTTGKPVLEDHTKTEAGMRTIPLLAPLADALPKDRIGLIFHNDKGNYLNSRQLSSLWRDFCDGVGLYTTEPADDGHGGCTGCGTPLPRSVMTPGWTSSLPRLCWDTPTIRPPWRFTPT